LEEQAGISPTMFDNVSAQLIKGGEDIALKFNTAGQTIRNLKHDIEDMQAALEAGGSASLLGPAIDSAKVLLKTTQDSVAETERHNAALLQLAQTYQGVSLEVAGMLQKQKDQLAIASTTTGQARMAAQEQATLNDLKGQGKTLEERTAIAAGQRAISQAQVNAAAASALDTLCDHAKVAATIKQLTNKRGMS
jgi:predicted YcjX-like family ATPase